MIQTNTNTNTAKQTTTEEVTTMSKTNADTEVKPGQRWVAKPGVGTTFKEFVVLSPDTSFEPSWWIEGEVALSGRQDQRTRTESAIRRYYDLATGISDAEAIELISDRLNSAATKHGLCSQFDEFVDELNTDAGRELIAPRTKRYRVTLVVDVTAAPGTIDTYMADMEAAALDEAPEGSKLVSSTAVSGR